MKIKKKTFFFYFLFFFWGGGCQGGCERRIEVFVKIQKRNWGGGGRGGGSRVGGVRVDLNEELNFL